MFGCFRLRSMSISASIDFKRFSGIPRSHAEVVRVEIKDTKKKKKKKKIHNRTNKCHRQRVTGFVQ